MLPIWGGMTKHSVLFVTSFCRHSGECGLGVLNKVEYQEKFSF